MRQLIFDIETTGLNYKEEHKIVEIAFLEIIDDHVTGNNFHFYINPEREIPEAVIKIHGITNEKVKNCNTIKQLDILNYIKDSVIIGHNVNNFDIPFLEFELGCKLTNESIDTLTLAKRAFTGQKNNLDALCERLGIDKSSRSLHGALIDCQLTYEVYKKLIAIELKKDITIEYQKFDDTNIKEII